MPLPEIFTEDPNEERLAGYFEELYDYLLEEGVPEDRLPNPWHVLSRVVRCIDSERLREWLDAYSAVEADPDHDILETEAEGEGTEPEPQRRMRRRPSYLRILDDARPDEPEPDPERGPDEPTQGQEAAPRTSDPS
jgi:hypothetical protein